MSDDAVGSDPVSWLLIQPGWKVVAADGTEVGEIAEVAGAEDIFNGLAVATSALGKPRYVLSEQVGDLTDGVVNLTITQAQVEQLGEYLEPPTSAQIAPDGQGGIGEILGANVRGIVGKVVAPIEQHERSMSLSRRIALFLRRKTR
jgi:hypothetical protein